MKLNIRELKKDQVVYICGINIHKGGRINLNKKPIKGIVTTEFGTIKLEDGTSYGDYPGYEIYDNLIKCEYAYERMLREAIEFCNKQMNKFNEVIEKL